jgi:hypothetical protein
MPIINVTDLNRAAEKYNPVLQVYPFTVLNDVLSALEINLLEVKGKDKFVTFERLGGTSKPYVAGAKILYSDLGKVLERVLEVKTSYNALKDHIMNFNGKLVATNDPASQAVDNKQKKHPLEALILMEKIKTIGEDILDAMFFAERDESDLSPMGMFDGFGKHIADGIAAGDIAVGKGNYFSTGPILAPVNGDTNAIDQLVNFIRAAHPTLRKRGVLYITGTTLFRAKDALGNKIPYKDAFSFNVFLEYLKGAAQAPNLKIITGDSLGTGDNLLLTIPRNLDFGVNTKGDNNFMQVRNPFEDPNFVQFWSQWDAGSRIRYIHAKTFMVNDGVPVSNELSGDYSIS